MSTLGGNSSNSRGGKRGGGNNRNKRGGSSLGGPPSEDVNTETQTNTSGTSLDVVSNEGGSSLGGTSLGGSSLGGSSLGGSNVKKGNKNRRNKKSNNSDNVETETENAEINESNQGSSLGGSSLGGSTLGGSTLGGSTLGGSTLGGGDDVKEEGGSKPKKRRGGAKKAAEKKEPEKKSAKKGPSSGVKNKRLKQLEMIKKQQEERERLEREAEEEAKRQEELELERLKRMEEDKIKKAAQLVEREKERKIQAKKRAEAERVKAREAALAKYGNVYVKGIHAKDEPKVKRVDKPKKEKPVEVVTKEASEDSDDSDSDTVENWEDDSDLSDTEDSKVEEVEVIEEVEVVKEAPLRSPICCVLGHVNTGKTFLLDSMRRTNVQLGEAGGITQQIGATYFPLENLKIMTSSMSDRIKSLSYKIPGLLVIDTPGHESFSNLRSRGSSLCDIAVLVIDIMGGVEPQTRESLNMLKKGKIPFIVALNKIDLLSSWKANPKSPAKDTLDKQDDYAQSHFREMVNRTINDLAVENINACLYYDNKNFKEFVSLVPTSAETGEGIPDLLMLIIQLTQKMMSKTLVARDSLECSVLEVKKIQGHGTTLDVILANGTLNVGDEIVIAGMHGEPIITHIKSLLTPPAMKELRIKSQYQHHQTVHASIGLKIAASGLDDAVAGSELFVIKPGDDVDYYIERAMRAMENLKGKVDRSGVGVYVMASTLGAMEALLVFLKKDCQIPVAGIKIGTVNKRDITNASVMHERGKPEYAVILGFDVEISREAEEFSHQLSVRILTADIIYQLQDRFLEYLDDIKVAKEEAQREAAIFPCSFTIMPDYVFNTKRPLIFGVHVDEGILRLGCPIIAVTPGKLLGLGKVTSIEKAGVEVKVAKAGDEVSIAIHQIPGNLDYTYGRQFDESHTLVSAITRESLDALKIGYEDVTRDNIKLLKKLKAVLDIK